MNIAPIPWTTSYDGHGGISIDDADGRQVGFVSSRREQEAHAALLKAAPVLLAYYRASMDLMSTLGHPDATAQDEHAADEAYTAAASAAAAAVAGIPR